MIDLDDAAYQNAQASRDAEADFRDESVDWSDEEWEEYEAERRAEYDAFNRSRIESVEQRCRLMGDAAPPPF